MPYTKDNPPKWAKNMPAGAQALAVRVFNAVYKQTNGNEEQARIAALAAIKRKFKKAGDKWIRKNMELETFIEKVRPLFKPIDILNETTLCADLKELSSVVGQLAGVPLAKDFTLDRLIYKVIKANPIRYEKISETFHLGLDGKPTFLKNCPIITDEVLILKDEPKFNVDEILDHGTYTRIDNVLTFNGQHLKGPYQLVDEKLTKLKIKSATHLLSLESTEIKFDKKGEIMYFEALGLAPGIWTGIDGHTTEYDAGVILEGIDTFAPKRVKSRHENKAEDVVGFTVGSKMVGDQAWVSGYVFDQDEIKAIEEDLASGKPLGISPELKCPSILDESRGVWVAQSLGVKAYSFVGQPACKQCWVRTVKKVDLN